MTALEKLRASNAWDPKHDLPLFPMHANPFIYMAYAARILETQPLDGTPALEKLAEYLSMRETSAGWIGEVSHDELYGAAFLSRPFARRLISRLYNYDGYYIQDPHQDPGPEVQTVIPPLEKWHFRFAFLEPALRQYAGMNLSLASDFKFALDIFVNAFTASPSDTSGILLRWLAAAEMKKHPLSGIAIWFWSKTLTAKRLTPKDIFSKHYLTEVPVMAEIAPDHFE